MKLSNIMSACAYNLLAVAIAELLAAAIDP
jgi:hypothetical protein